MLKKWLPHAAILLANMYIVFFVLDKFNKAMTFINNDITKALLLILALISISNACMLIAERRRSIRAAMKKTRKAAPAVRPASPARPVPQQGAKPVPQTVPHKKTVPGAKQNNTQSPTF